jgi:hypothetical protein
MSAKTVTGYEPRFDIDMRRGAVGEEKVLHVLDAFAAGRIEVKTDYGVWKTGNLYIEYEKENRDGEWVPSGIRATEADHWAFAFRDGALIVDTARLRTMCEAYIGLGLTGYRAGNANSSGSRGVKLPLEALNHMLTSYGEPDEADTAEE